MANICKILIATVLAAALVYVRGQDVPVDIAYLADDPNDESFARSFIPKYFKSALKLLPSDKDRDRVKFTLNVVRMYQTLDRSVVDALNKKAALYMGDYDDSFAQVGYLRKRENYVPYIITGRSGFINYEDRDLGNYECNRTVSDDVISFFPPRTALSHLILKACPNYIRKITLIGENAFEINLILESLHAAVSTCFDLSTFIIDKKWSKEKGMRVLRNALKLRPQVIAIYTFRMDYATRLFQMAYEANMLTFQHQWYLLHPDIEGIPDEMDKLLRDSFARVTGFQLISRENFARFGLEPPRDHIIKHASILDVMIKLASSVRDHMAAGKGGRLTAATFIDWVNNKSWEGYEDTVGSYTDRLEMDANNNFFCRKSFKTTYYAYEQGKMHKVRDFLYDDYLGSSTPDDEKNRITKQYKIAGSREKRQTTTVNNPRVQIVNKTDTISGAFQYLKDPPKDSDIKMPLFYKNKIRAVAILTPPMVMENRSEDGTLLGYKGMMVDYLLHYSNSLRVEYSIDKVVKRRRDLYLALDSGLYDVGIGSLGMSGIRYKQTDYTDTVRLGRITLLTKKLEVKSYPWQFLQPFTWAVWVSLGVVFILTSILLTVMDILDWTDESFPVRDSFYYTAGLLCNGSTDTTPATVPSRLMICCLMFFAIVVSNSYTANMTAFLTMRKAEDLPQTLQALAVQTAAYYSYVQDSEIDRIFTDNENDPYGAIVNRRKTKNIPLYGDIEEAVNFIKDTKAPARPILITEEYTANYFSSKYCDLEVVLQPSEPIYYTIMLPFGATYREDLNEAILSVREGYKDFDTVESYYDKERCTSDDEVAENSKTRRLKWAEMVGVFYVLLMGAGLAIIVGLIGECYVRLILKKQRKRTPWKDFKNECKARVNSLRNICPGNESSPKK